MTRPASNRGYVEFDPRSAIRDPWHNVCQSVVASAGPWLLAAVFAVSGMSKGADPQPTAKVIGVLSGGFVPGWSVAGLVLVEILLASWLVSGFRPRAALLVSIGLLLSFSLALGALLVTSPTSPCGCGLPVLSGSTTVDNGIGIARNFLLIAIAALAWPARTTVHTGIEESR